MEHPVEYILEYCASLGPQPNHRYQNQIEIMDFEQHAKEGCLVYDPTAQSCQTV